MKFHGLIFDMDGTLTEPVIDFAAMRSALGIPDGDMLAVIHSWPTERQVRAFAIIEAIEEEARARLVLRPGVKALMHELGARGLRRGLMTRNTARSVEHLVRHLPSGFDPVLTRAFRPIKPDPAPVFFICRAWALPPSSVLVVGDHRDDLACARAAGATSCLARHGTNGHYASEADHVVDDLSEIVALLG